MIDILDQDQRKQRLQLLELRTKLYRRAHKAGNLTPEQKTDYLIDLREIEKLKRIDRSENDVLYFMYEYFSDDRNLENDQNLSQPEQLSRRFRIFTGNFAAFIMKFTTRTRLFGLPGLFHGVMPRLFN